MSTMLKPSICKTWTNSIEDDQTHSYHLGASIEEAIKLLPRTGKHVLITKILVGVLNFCCFLF